MCPRKASITPSHNTMQQCKNQSSPAAAHRTNGRRTSTEDQYARTFSKKKSNDRQTASLRLLVSIVVVLGFTVPVRRLRDVVPLPKMDFETIRSDIPLVAALHRADVSRLVFPGCCTVLRLQMPGHVADSMNASQYRSAVVRTRYNALCATGGRSSGSRWMCCRRT